MTVSCNTFQPFMTTEQEVSPVLMNDKMSPAATPLITPIKDCQCEAAYSEHSPFIFSSNAAVTSSKTQRLKREIKGLMQLESCVRIRDTDTENII